MSSLSRSLSLPLDLEGRTTIESLGHVLLSEPPNITAGNEEVTESKKFEVQSIIHKHPSSISWKDSLNNDDDDEDEIVCGDCSKGDPDDSNLIYRYSCIPCNHSSHESCGELPQKIRHSLHPQHLLHLFVSPKEYPLCDVCQEVIFGSKYKCTLCDFNLHLRCALSNTFQKPQDHHKHSFVIFKPTFFTCDGCGVDEINKKCVSCVCTTCQLQVHKKCSHGSFPVTVKFSGHFHKLHLSYSFQIDFDYARLFCKICFRKMNNVFCIYLCTDCTYIAHASCVYSRFKNEDLLETEKEDFTLLNSDEAEDAKEKEIIHFSHPHCLYERDESRIDAICNGCTRPISDSFYTCGDDQCNFFLHKQCFELPKWIQHPLHDHRLVLQKSSDKLLPFGCDACSLLCNGFVFSCSECYFELDVGCSLFSHALDHEGHKCSLTLILAKERTECSACDSECLCYFLCEGCNFKLDLKCASLPKRVRHECPKHEWNAHPLILTYHAIDDGLSGDYYCDICEETRNENHWFYFCQDCNYSLHPKCVLGKELIKYGETYEVQKHPHPLSLIKMPKNDHFCNSCGDPCSKYLPFVYFCAQCNIYIHHWLMCTGGKS